MATEKKLVNAGWLARRLSVCRSTAYTLAKGKIPCIKIGGVIRFDPETIERIIREEEVESVKTKTAE